MDDVRGLHKEANADRAAPEDFRSEAYVITDGVEECAGKDSTQEELVDAQPSIRKGVAELMAQTGATYPVRWPAPVSGVLGGTPPGE